MAEISIIIPCYNVAEYLPRCLDALMGQTYQEWEKYRQMNPNAKAFLLRADTYLTAPISEADAEKYGIIQIFGWNDSVMDYIHYCITEKKDEHD